MQQKLQKITTNFLFFLELQLLISIVILPIVMTWGLPCSVMSIIGNLIFTQFLTVFICIAAVLFVTDLLGIANSYVACALEWTTQAWHYVLSFGSPHWLIGFSTWLLPISYVCAVGGCLIYYKKIERQSHRIALLTCLYLLIPTIAALSHQHTCKQVTVLQGTQKMHIIALHGNMYAFDCGALSARPSSQSWIEYTLAPTMIQALGATHIDVLVISTTNSRTDVAVQALTQHIPTKKVIYINHRSAKQLKTLHEQRILLCAIAQIKK